MLLLIDMNIILLLNFSGLRLAVNKCSGSVLHSASYNENYLIDVGLAS